jgi:hypothetical protein
VVSDPREVEFIVDPEVDRCHLSNWMTGGVRNLANVHRRHHQPHAGDRASQFVVDVFGRHAADLGGAVGLVESA